MIDFNKYDRELRARGIDIFEFKDGLGNHIEPRISCLVLALNYKGYKTTMSCEGHPIEEYYRRCEKEVKSGKAIITDERKNQFTIRRKDPITKKGRTYFEQFTHIASPWVDVKINGFQQLKLWKLLHDHNSQGEIKWSMEGRCASPVLRFLRGDTYRIQSSPEHDLYLAQEDIPRLAERIILS